MMDSDSGDIPWDEQVSGHVAPACILEPSLKQYIWPHVYQECQLRIFKPSCHQQIPDNEFNKSTTRAYSHRLYPERDWWNWLIRLMLFGQRLATGVESIPNFQQQRPPKSTTSSRPPTWGMKWSLSLHQSASFMTAIFPCYWNWTTPSAWLFYVDWCRRF